MWTDLNPFYRITKRSLLSAWKPYASILQQYGNAECQDAIFMIHPVILQSSSSSSSWLWSTSYHSGCGHRILVKTMVVHSFCKGRTFLQGSKICMLIFWQNVSIVTQNVSILKFYLDLMTKSRGSICSPLLPLRTPMVMLNNKSHWTDSLTEYRGNIFIDIDSTTIV